MGTSTSIDYAKQAIKGIREVYHNAVQFDLNKFRDQRIMDVYTTSEFSEIHTSTEGMTGIKELSERETPPTLALNDGYSVNISEKRYGGAIEVTETMFRQAGDSTTRIDGFLMQQQNQLIQTGRNEILNYGFYILNEAANASALTLAPDGEPLLGDHVWKTGDSTGFTNLATAVFSEAEVDKAEAYAGDFKDPSGKPMPLNFDTIIVKKGSDSSRTAKRLFASNIVPEQIDNVNVYYGEYRIVETPYISNKNSWFMRDSSLMNSVRVGLSGVPSLDEPIAQNNKAVRSNSTWFMKRGIFNLPFDWYGYVGS